MPGPAGDAGPRGLPGAQTVNLAAEAVSVLNAVINQVNLGATSTVTFTVTDGAGRGAVGLRGGSSGQVRATLAKLVPGATTGDPSMWVNYFNRVAGTGSARVIQATSERGTVVDNGDGTYTYTFAGNITDARNPITDAGIAFEDMRTHRLVLQISGTINGNPLPAINAVRDLVPANPGGPVTDRRDIIENKSCNECHGRIVAHGSRYESGYCVVCHNVSTGTVGTTATPADMSFMTHAIHASRKRAAEGLPHFELGGEDYGEVTYPQDLRHCRKCHEASTAAPQGDSWQSSPNRNSCFACHAVPATPIDHAALPNSACTGCHTRADILARHRTDNPTTNNPVLEQGVARIDYEVPAVTINAQNQAEITFRILRDGQPINFTTGLSDLTGGPSFLLAWATPQDGVSSPIDYNNAGGDAGITGAQPVSVALASLRTGSTAYNGGTLTGPLDGGFYLARTNWVFPGSAQLRSVTLQGYFTQVDAGIPGTQRAIARHAVSVVRTVAGDTPRRVIADSNKCANCHEWFEAHGGNRVFEVQACAVCHNPNLSTSGTGADPATALARLRVGAAGDAGIDFLTARGFDPANPLGWPESTNNLKDMIHAIHGSGARTTPYVFVRDRGSSGIFPYDFSEVTYPNETNNCLACHVPGTYDTNLPEGELASTYRTPGAGTPNRTGILAARATLPNPEDVVVSPAAAACSTCHDNVQARNHMRLNGAYFGPRSGLLAGNLETCNVCHGTGRTADAVAAHEQ